jgi:hypothetical protein
MFLMSGREVIEIVSFSIITILFIEMAFPRK